MLPCVFWSWIHEFLQNQRSKGKDMMICKDVNPPHPSGKTLFISKNFQKFVVFCFYTSSGNTFRVGSWWSLESSECLCCMGIMADSSHGSPQKSIWLQKKIIDPNEGNTYSSFLPKSRWLQCRVLCCLVSPWILEALVVRRLVSKIFHVHSCGSRVLFINLIHFIWFYG